VSSASFASAPLAPNSTIGIVGGGQLGRMTALAAARLGYRCHILSEELDSPAGLVAAAETVGRISQPILVQSPGDEHGRANGDQLSREYWEPNANGAKVCKTANGADQHTDKRKSPGCISEACNKGRLGAAGADRQSRQEAQGGKKTLAPIVREGAHETSLNASIRFLPAGAVFAWRRGRNAGKSPRFAQEMADGRKTPAGNA